MAWKRKAARVILFDRDKRVFLMQAHDPADPTKGQWWEIPGGGIDFGETSAQAAARELYEEAGIVADEMGPCIWRQQVRFRFGGIEFDSDDHVHVAWCETGDYSPTHLEALEAMAFEGARWWTLDEVLASDERFLPEPLVAFLPALAAGDLPDEPVVVAAVGD
ncbi:MAG TPA: NUDIX domain-containing protein [Acidimicrobiales bacterium]|nr:NUDIX domain-containing protein [Acidimicrobiales bacterium]